MEGSIAAPGRTRAILAERQIRLRKAWGQNFLVDANLAAKIVRLAGVGPADVVVEIGPGIGALTQELAAQARLVLAIEIDQRLLPALEENLAGVNNVQVICGDALQADYDGLVAAALQIADRGRLPSYKLVANLPYYISTPLLVHLLQGGFRFSDLTVMLQEEVGQRLLAQPGSKEYGSLTVLAGYYAEVAQLMRVPPTVFLPRPEVASAVLSLRLRATPPVAVPPAILFPVVRAAFGRRRKTILNALETLGLPRDTLASALRAAGIDPGRRGESLSLQEFANLADSLERLNRGDVK